MTGDEKHELFASISRRIRRFVLNSLNSIRHTGSEKSGKG